MTNEASATGMQGIDDLTIIPSDFLKDMFNSTSSAASGLSSHDWGVHNNTINMGSSTSLSIKQVLLWGGIALLGWFLVRKIRR